MLDSTHRNALYQEHIRPSVLYRPALMTEGNQWMALYGDMATGLAGFGDTPAQAMADFDLQFNTNDRKDLRARRKT